MRLTPWALCVVLGVFLSTVLDVGHSLPQGNNNGEAAKSKSKLLYILMDGFRWDYVEKQERDALPGFNKFLKEGVRARWTIPLFPSLSFPSWTTLGTGLYAENHNIIGNYFYDPVAKEEFSLSNDESSKKPKWWTSEPIWTTAEKAGLKTAQFQWGKCEVPFDNRVTHHCEPYLDAFYHLDNFLKNIMKALTKIDEGYDFVQVYTIEPDVRGHIYGPDSQEVLSVVRDLDSVLSILMDELQERNLSDNVNIVIVSDHGMQYTASGAMQRHEVDQYLDLSLVEKIAGSGGTMKFTVPQENIQKVFDQLSEIPGASVYKKADIPESFHFKNAIYAPDILVVAQEGHLVMPSSSVKQLPPSGKYVSKGSHGFNDNTNMRGIFFAKGPAFQKGVVIDPIHLVDIYQVVTHALKIEPQPHNGTWSHVEPAFA